MSLTEPRPRHRYHGIDVVRLLSFIAIAIHHFVWVIWYSAPPEEATHAGWFWVSAYARSISFSGHTILFLSCYLIAKAETRVSKTWKVVGLVAFGWFLFCLFEWGQNPVFWIWDIYPLIVIGLATALMFRQISTKLVYAAGLVGFLMTWIEFWNWPVFESLPLQWRHWLVGDCRVDLADWPILPWIGILWMPYAIGTWDRQLGSRTASHFSLWRKWEWALWPVLLVGALPRLGAFYNITLGPDFACFSFRQTPLVFWSHFVYVVFLLRISLLDRVEVWLAKWSLVRAIGNLRISQAFGIAYLIHYTLIEMIRFYFGKPLAASSNMMLVTLVFILPLTELLVRALEKVMSLRRSSPSKPSV